MLPNYKICRQHVEVYQRKTAALSKDTVSFATFWNYKMQLEQSGQSILAEKHLSTTAARLSRLLSFLEIKNPGILENVRLKQVLRNMQPDYGDIRQLTLGSGKLDTYRDQIESIYERMDKKGSRSDDVGRGFSIVAKSAILMAIWGQTPRFDSTNRKRFEKWIHWPYPEKLPFLTIRDTWYRPDEFREMVVALDKWVAAWPLTNNGKSFENSFSDLCPGIPPGRLIDIIYHWKLPNTKMDYRLQTGGSYYDKSYNELINKYTLK
jgi:hypothetical protein